MTANSGSKAAADVPAKHLVMQAAMRMHVSQSTGASDFDGQQGMSPAISSVMAAAIWSATTAAGAPDGRPAIAGRETGANANAAIIRIEISRPMGVRLVTRSASHKTAAMDSRSTGRTRIP